VSMGLPACGRQVFSSRYSFRPNKKCSMVNACSKKIKNE